jgi:hypothetical protein
MALGPGKYDDAATVVMEMTKAAGVLVMVIGGERGQGFSFQGDLELTRQIPKMLRTVADQIEDDLNSPELPRPRTPSATRRR